MRSKWLDTASSSENLHDDDSSDVRAQPSTSGRHHGPRWFSVMQGIRRSLDVHFKSYYKIDSAFASTLRLTSASDKLQTLTRAVADTGLVEFCCVYLVHPARGTFGVIALSGAGSELYPPRLADEDAQRAIRMSDTGSQSFLNVFTRCVFQVNDSNWCVEDVVASKAPWYYDCASAANGFGLPQDGGWLRRAGMRSMLALPCMQGNDVTGVLAVASKQKSLDHLLLRKLEELCYKITPTVTDAVVEYSPLLCNRRVAARYESITDFAHEVLGELLNLDRAVAASVSGLNRSAACVSQSHQQQQEQQARATAGARAARKEERSVFDATAAVAAAAAAGFTWTAPAAVADAAVQMERPSMQNGVETFCTAGTDAAMYSVVLTSDLASAVLPHMEVPSTISVGVSERPTPMPATEPLHLGPLDCEAAPSVAPAVAAAVAAAPQAGQPTHGSSQSNGWSRAPHVGTSRSLPERSPAAAACGGAVDYLRGCAHGPSSSSSRHHQHHAQPQQQQGGAPRPASSGERHVSRSTRSLSCLEFSGGVADAREFLNSGGASEAATAAASAAAAAAPKCTANDASGRKLRAPHQLCTESGAGGCEVGFMLDSRSTEELAAALRNEDSTMISPSAWSSSKNMESRVMQRGAPLEASGGAAAGRTGGAAAAAPPPPLAAARGSSCATDCSVADTVTTYGYANGSSHNANSSWYGSAALRLSAASATQGGVAGDAAEVRTSLHGTARGRWSRDSAAAAAAVWGNEAAEAVAAAIRFTAEQVSEELAAAPLGCGGAESGSSFWTARAATPSRHHRPVATRGYHGGATSAAIGGLYGIRESGPVPSLPLSLEFSDSDDGGVAVVEMSSSACGGGFVLSSGLGTEALRRHRQRRGSSCSRGSSGSPSQPLSQVIDAFAGSPAAAAPVVLA